MENTTNTTVEVSEIEGKAYIVETTATVTYKDRKLEVQSLLSNIAQMEKDITEITAKKEKDEARLVEIGYVDGEELVQEKVEEPLEELPEVTEE